MPTLSDCIALHTDRCNYYQPEQLRVLEWYLIGHIVTVATKQGIFVIIKNIQGNCKQFLLKQFRTHKLPCTLVYASRLQSFDCIFQLVPAYNCNHCKTMNLRCQMYFKRYLSDKLYFYLITTTTGDQGCSSVGYYTSNTCFLVVVASLWAPSFHQILLALLVGMYWILVVALG